MRHRTSSLVFLLMVLAPVMVLGGAQIPYSSSASLKPLPRETSSQDRLPSNSIIDLEFFDRYLFAATGEGLSRFQPLSGGEPAEGGWLIPTVADGFGRGGVSGLAIGITADGDTVVWAATAIDTSIGGESYAAGGGVGVSYDHGNTWQWMPQPVDSRDEENFEPTVTAVQNVTYDIGVLGNRVWIASWGGGLRYFDMAAETPTWINSPPDTNAFDVLQNLNHRVFSIAVMDTLLWVGTADGVNLSRDRGETWQKFQHSAGSEVTLTGNFVPALGAQITNSGKHIIWAATWTAEGSTEYYGVSKSEDMGITWARVLGSVEEPIRAHNFAFEDSVVYVCTDDGLLKSADYGETWGTFPPIRDAVTGERTYEQEIYSSATGTGRLFVGGPDGLGISDDGGFTWALERSYPIPGKSGQPDAYAYPNPFSPSRFSVVRFQYRLEHADEVTLEIYDFAMELLIRPVKDAYRIAGDHSEVWNGLGPGGREIANGVYFFRLTGGGEERWGKVLILD